MPYLGGKMKEKILGENESDPPPAKKVRTRIWASLVGAGVVVGLLSAIIAVGGTTNAVRTSQCNSKANWVREALLRCHYATVEEAKEIIGNYYSAASGADPENGKVHLSRTLLDAWSPDDYSKQWANIGWAEVVGSPEPLPNTSANTFKVLRKMYGSPNDSSTDAAGYISDIYEEIELSQVGESWKIAHTSRAGRNENRKWTQYGIAVLTENQPSFTEADTAIATTYDNWQGGRQLPVYCFLESPSATDQSVTGWVRTSVGWLPSSKVSLTANETQSCQPL